MSETSCIVWGQRKEPFVQIRLSALYLCDGDHCAAALLSYFEYWHNNRLDNRKQGEHRNKVAHQHGEEGTQDVSLLQWHNEAQIEDGLLRLYGRTVIRKAIALLIEKDFLSLHRNPVERYSFDRTHYFLFHEETVQKAVYNLPDQLKITDALPENNARSRTSNAPSHTNTPTRKEKALETTQEKKVREKNKGVFVGHNGRKHAHTTPLATYGDAVSWHDGTQWLGHFPRPRDPEPDPDLADAVHDMLQAYYTSYVNRDTWVRGPLEHPLLKEWQLLRIESTLRRALAILFAAGPCDPIALVDQFWGYRERGRGDGNVNLFATPGMLAQLAYECRYIQKEDTTWQALIALTD